jgi:hypothetical protein
MLPVVGRCDLREIACCIGSRSIEAQPLIPCPSPQMRRRKRNGWHRSAPSCVLLGFWFEEGPTRMPPSAQIFMLTLTRLNLPPTLTVMLLFNPRLPKGIEDETVEDGDRNGKGTGHGAPCVGEDDSRHNEVEDLN